MANNFQTESVLSPGATFASHDESTVHHPLAVVEFGGVGSKTVVEDSAGKRLPVKAVIAPDTSGGYDTYHKVAAASTNAASIKAAPGQVFAVRIFNNTSYPVFVKLHDTAGVPTAGAGVKETFGMQAGVGFPFEFPAGIAFAAGIGITIVKDIADAGATAVALNDCVVDIEYK